MERKNIKIEFRYDGSRYYGFQRQPDKVTVQGEIEKILKIVTKEDINLISILHQPFLLKNTSIF